MIKSVFLVAGLIVLSAVLIGCTAAEIRIGGMSTSPVSLRLKPNRLFELNINLIASEIEKTRQAVPGLEDEAFELAPEQPDVEAGEGILLDFQDDEVVEVIIRDYKAHPEKITIAPGTKIRWLNMDRVSHTVTGAGFDSGTINPGEKFEHAFEKRLRYIYKSTIHNKVLGEVIVRGE